MDFGHFWDISCHLTRIKKYKWYKFWRIFCFHFVWSVIVGACMRMWINPPNTERSLKSIFRWKLHNVFFSPPLHFSLYCLVGRKTLSGDWFSVEYQSLLGFFFVIDLVVFNFYCCCCCCCCCFCCCCCCWRKSGDWFSVEHQSLLGFFFVIDLVVFNFYCCCCCCCCFCWRKSGDWFSVKHQPLWPLLGPMFPIVPVWGGARGACQKDSHYIVFQLLRWNYKYNPINTYSNLNHWTSFPFLQIWTSS